MSNEADTCRKYVLPKLYAAGWNDDQIHEQKYFTDGRIVPLGRRHRRNPGKKTDYLLSYRPDFPIALVEAKADYKLPSDGLQQAMAYGEILDVRFAYSTNGHGIVEHDYTTGRQTLLEGFPRPEDLWSRLRGSQVPEDENAAKDLTIPRLHGRHASLRGSRVRRRAGDLRGSSDRREGRPGRGARPPATRVRRGGS